MLGYADEPETLDIQALAPSSVNRATLQIFDVLVWQTPDTKFHPGLASSWEISPDGKAVTFRLRKDVTFHDGTPVTAEAIKFSLDRVVDPATKSSSALVLLGPHYDRTEVLDQFAARVHFKQAYAPFFAGLAQSFLAPVHPQNAKSGDIAQRPIGTGPFRVVEWVRQQRLRLEKNPTYNWAPTTVFSHSGPPYLDAVTFRYIPEGSSRVAALETGEVDLIRPIPTQEIRRLEADARFKVEKVISPGTAHYVVINMSKEPTNDPVLRRAIAHAINRKAIVDTVYFGVFDPAFSVITKATFSYDSSLEKDGGVYPYDVARARALLEGAGWKLSTDGIRVKDGKRLALTFIYPTFIDTGGPLAEIVQAQLREIGIDAVPRRITGAAFFEAASTGQHHLALTRALVTDPDMVRLFWHSSNIRPRGFNWTFHRNDEFDRLADQASQMTPPDSEERKKIYQKLQRMVLEAAVAVPVFNTTETVAYKKTVRGVRFDGSSYLQLYDVWKERA